MLITPLLVGAQDRTENSNPIKIEDIIFLPPEYYVGDRVELRLKVYPVEGIEIDVPDSLPEAQWVDFQRIDVISRSHYVEVIIHFTSFAPGTRTLPAVRLGDIILDSLRIHTSSLIHESDFNETKGQVLLPGTALGLGLIIGVLLFGPVLIIVLSGKFMRTLQLVMIRRRGKKPIRKLNRVLRSLEEEKDKMSSRRFYFLLSEELRSYLTRRTGKDFTTITTGEFASQLSQLYDVSAKSHWTDQLITFMKSGDNYKFGGLTAAGEQKRSDIELVRKFAYSIEKSYVGEEKKKQDSQKDFTHKGAL